MQPCKPLHGPLPKPEGGKKQSPNPPMPRCRSHLKHHHHQDLKYEYHRKKTSQRDDRRKLCGSPKLFESPPSPELFGTPQDVVVQPGEVPGSTYLVVHTWWHILLVVLLYTMSLLTRYWNWWWYLYEGDSNHDRDGKDSRGFDGVLGNFLLLSHCLPNLADAYWCCEFSDLNISFHLTY